MESDLLSNILSSGSDSRQLIDPLTGLNQYHCSYIPVPDIVQLGSCTSSDISQHGYHVSSKLLKKLQAIDDQNYQQQAIDETYKNFRAELKFLTLGENYNLAQVLLTPSGTDAEILALAITAGISNRPIQNIVVGSLEIGSGSILAAQGKYFDPLLPNGETVVVGQPLDEEFVKRVHVKEVTLRDEQGTPYEVEQLDAMVQQCVDTAINENAHVLLHLVAHSKTGFHAPSIKLIKKLQEQYPDNINVVVDAAQGRFSKRGLTHVIEQGHMVILTGSKFFGGPAFCGSLLVPQKLRAYDIQHWPDGIEKFLNKNQIPESWLSLRKKLSDNVNIGLLLRWAASLSEIREYYSIPSGLRLKILRLFESQVPKLLAKSSRLELECVPEPIYTDDFERLLQSKNTVFSFYIRKQVKDTSYFGYDELRTIYLKLSADCSNLASNKEEHRILARKFKIGQPVKPSQHLFKDKALLRIALGALLISLIAQDTSLGNTLEQRLQWLKNTIDDLRQKIELLASHYDQ